MKLVTICGTRPEFVRLSRLISLLDEISDHSLINTGQNYDPNLSNIFFRDLQIREPDLVIESRSDSLAAAISSIMGGVESFLVKERPDGVLVLGDTNSSLSAIIAERLGFPVFHMEAGNRSFDSRVPEELNRKLVDHISTYNLPYTDYARTNLLREGLHQENICVTGSPIPEVVSSLGGRIQESDILQRLGVSKKNFFIVSSHRQETVDSFENLATLVTSINRLAAEWKVPVVLSAHPRLLSRVKHWGLKLDKEILICEPFGYVDYLALQTQARCVFSDSGSLPEESGFLGFPAVVIRDSFERQESLDYGFIGLAGLSYDGWIQQLTLREGLKVNQVPNEYASTEFSSRVANFVFSKLHSRGVST